MGKSMDDERLIETLIVAITRQLELYRQLNEVSQRLLSQVVLSRGDVSGVGPALLRKQALLQQIAAVRTGSQESVALWQDRKSRIGKGPRVADLDRQLEDMEAAIRQFLDKEDQLKRYIEHAMSLREPGRTGRP